MATNLGKMMEAIAMGQPVHEGAVPFENNIEQAIREDNELHSPDLVVQGEFKWSAVAEVIAERLEYVPSDHDVGIGEHYEVNDGDELTIDITDAVGCSINGQHDPELVEVKREWCEVQARVWAVMVIKGKARTYVVLTYEDAERGTTDRAEQLENAISRSGLATYRCRGCRKSVVALDPDLAICTRCQAREDESTALKRSA